MNFGFWLGVYLALGLPIAVGLALTESGAPLIRRVAVALIMLPIWPAWSVEMVWVHWRQSNLIMRRTVCAWCGEKIGFETESWQVHLMVCPKHPIRLWLQAQGWDIVDDGDGDYVLGEAIQSAALTSILEERIRQEQKWGEQNHDPYTYLAILIEEVGEMAQAALQTQFGGKHGGLDHLREEAVQTAAVALAIVECLDRGKWQWNKKDGGE